MSDFETIDSQDWNTIAPQFAALAVEEFMAVEVGDWLIRWSELEKNLAEAGARAAVSLGLKASPSNYDSLLDG